MLNLLDKLTDPPDGGEGQKWVAGILLPLMLVLYAASCVLYGYATLVFREGGRARSHLSNIKFVTVEGSTLGWYLALVISIAAYCHFQWYWGNDKRLVYYYEPMRMLALVAAIGLLLFNIVRAFVYS